MNTTDCSAGWISWHSLAHANESSVHRDSTDGVRPGSSSRMRASTPFILSDRPLDLPG